MEDKQVELPFGCVVYNLCYTPERHQISKLTFPAEMRLFIPQNSSKNILTDLHKNLSPKYSPKMEIAGGEFLAALNFDILGSTLVEFK